MFDKFIRFAKNKIDTLPWDVQEDYYLKTMIILLDGEDNMCRIIQEIEDKNLSEEESKKELFEAMNLPSTMNFSINNLPNTISETIIVKYNQKEKELHSTKFEKESKESYLKKREQIARLLFKMLYNIDIRNMSRNEFITVLHKELFWSKEDIAKECGVDKKTFTKWLLMVYGDNRFEGKRKFNLNEYQEIFEKLFLAKSENKLNINKNLDVYFDRIRKGISFEKRDIIELSESNYKTIEPNLSELNVKHYKSANKFPFSIAHDMLNDLD